MKNYLKMILAVVIAIPMLLSLSSCDKEEKKDIYSGSFELTYKALGDLFSVADIEISYYDENGTLRSETMTQTVWHKKISYKKLPANTGFKVIHKVKSQLPQGKTEFDLEQNYSNDIYLLKNDKEVMDNKSHNSELINSGVTIEKLERMLTVYDVEEFLEITEKGITYK